MTDVAPRTHADERVLEWVGGFPSRWSVETLGSQFTRNRSPNRGLIESRVLSLSYGRVIIRDLDKRQSLLPKSFETYQVLEPGDIVIRPTDLQNDRTSLRVGQTWYRGIITSAYLALRPTRQMSSRYGAYLLKAYDYLKVFYGFGSGLRQNLDFHHIKYLPVPAPPGDEQETIVRYLDHAELRIARAIQAKMKGRDLLMEMRQATIERQVLGGMSYPLKESQLPLNWEIRPMRWLLSPTSDRGRPESPLLSVLRTRGVIPRDYDKAINHNAIPKDLSNYRVVRKGDLVINKMKAWCGSLGVSEYEGIVSPAYFTYKIREGYAPYWNLLLRSNSLKNEFARYSEGVRVGQWDLSPSAVREIRIPVPPIDEQRLIAAITLDQTHELDVAIAAASNEIDLLREYRTRLIADVVTGRKDVRVEAAGLPDVDPLELANVLSGTSAIEDDVDGEVETDAD